MSLVLVAAILVPTIFVGFVMGWLWLFLLTGLVFVPLLFIERRLDNP